MYVTRLRLDGVRGFHGPRAVDLDFTRPDGGYAGWTVLAGRNGSGKTTLLRAIALGLVGYRAVRLDQDLEDWLSTGKDSGGLALHVRWDPGQDREAPDFHTPRLAAVSWEAGFEASFFADPPLASLLWNRGRRGHGGGWFFVGYGPFRRLSEGTYEGRVPNRLTSVRTLFDAQAALTDAVDWLIQVHARALEGDTEAQRLKASALAVLSDGLLRDGYAEVSVDTRGLLLTKNGKEFRLRHMSDGYGATAALVLDILRHMHAAYGSLQVEERDGRVVCLRPGVVLVDEIDAHLHVSWQRDIGEWLTRHFPQIQFIVTTHSPYICQAADPNGLIRLPGPDEQEAPRVVDDELYGRVVNGTGDDAVLSELFGMDSPYSARAEELRSELAELELAVVTGQADEAQRRRFAELRDRLSSSQVARVDEVLRRLELSPN